MRRRFFVEKFETNRAVADGETAEHLGRVLRAKPGQLYELSDGRKVWLAKIDRVGRGEIEFSLVERIPASEPALITTLLLAIVKFERFEWAIEKATELGVSAIVPLAAERSEAALIAAAEKRAARWRKIALESAQQARRLRPPELRPIARPKDAFAANPAAVRVLLSERADAPGIRAILESARDENAKSAAVAIGPEGGWTETEFDAARAAGFREASLGENILRTETAVCAALSSLRYAVG